MLNLLGDNKVKNRRNTKILYKGRYVKYPFENGLADLPKEDNFECLYYFIQNLIKKEKGDLKEPKNLKEWFYYTFGKGIAEKYLIPYNEKIWKYPIEKISLDWVERVPNPPIEDIIKSALGIETEGYTHQLYFYYPKMGGISALITAIEERVNYNRTIKNFEVKEIRKNIFGQWKISDGKEIRYYDKIISTIPLPVLLNALETSNEIKEVANNLKFRSLVTVMIGVRNNKINDFTWLYIPDRDVLTHRVSFPSNYSPYNAPEGCSSILAEITCEYRDKIWKMEDEEIIERTISDLERIGIIKNDLVVYSKVRKTKFAYVVNDLDYSKNIKILREHMREIGIDLVGRFGEFRYLNMDGCIRRVMEYLDEMDKNKI
ncbi:MAG: FAD-dependent oxidoreductase [Elusimicrobiota bacterium]|nr:FAD-dependent oxidoreductase [Endomicrobiia bacterium]MDW8166622.1 FAD-dependent oxidoreductase [Elusimicrobiota bacterium]